MTAVEGAFRLPFPGRADPWCSGPTCQPVTLEIAGSNPVGSANFLLSNRRTHDAPSRRRPPGARVRPARESAARESAQRASPPLPIVVLVVDFDLLVFAVGLRIVALALIGVHQA